MLGGGHALLEEYINLLTGPWLSLVLKVFIYPLLMAQLIQPEIGSTT